MMQYKNQEIDSWTLLSSNSHGHPSFANCPNNALTHYLSHCVPFQYGAFPQSTLDFHDQGIFEDHMAIIL